ncbi:YhcN/YlaJ family sporulation lipoprotein [Paenibacillus senegalimassiliensis]|uniref:YhcN/YlaJ family sporulation lipoprotein n=1 Tax=Paenibacillus senegalimassiliensis TaxID=1737426 RepID=UPI00073F9BE6|nr:YhcN/YlaJ family sporulation lipoprotein [Paenibacillus senegalimassiliensis]
MRIWLCLLLLASLLTSCGTNTEKASPSPRDQTENVPRAQSADMNTNNLTDKENLTDRDKQIYLEELVTKVPGVQGAHCVIMGKTAVVGIDVDSKLERARVGSIKYTVAEALRKDKHGANAIVTADIDLNQRIAEIGQKIREGHPISGFATELADIIGRIVPQMPSDTQPPEGINPKQLPKTPGSIKQQQNPKNQR